MKLENDLGKDKISQLVFRIAIPSMLAQFVSVLYSLVDRIFVGNIAAVGDVSLAGVGVCGPIVTMIGSFALLIGIGGTPLMGIALGEGKREQAKHIVANCFVMLCAASVLVTVLALALKEPMLRLFGASDITYPYAEAYFTAYISGTIFALLSMGLYQFVIAQGYAKVGMFSIIIGAVMNIILDPIFIYLLNMGVRGAAIATVISQGASAAFVFVFMLRKADIKISFGGYNVKTMMRVLKIGLSPFLIIAFDNLMIIAMNGVLVKSGGSQGDMLITINTIVQSFMLMLTMPLGGISGSTHCILSYNYGAGNSKRVIEAEKYITALCVVYTGILFIGARVAGQLFVSLFTKDPILNERACQAIRISTMGAIPLGIQYAFVDGFTGMGQVQFALPMSCFRKTVYFIAVFTIPLLLDPSMIFYAEPISDFMAVAFSIPIYLWGMKRILRKRKSCLSLVRQLERALFDFSKIT